MFGSTSVAKLLILTPFVTDDSCMCLPRLSRHKLESPNVKYDTFIFGYWSSSSSVRRLWNVLHVWLRRTVDSTSRYFRMSIKTLVIHASNPIIEEDDMLLLLHVNRKWIWDMRIHRLRDKRRKCENNNSLSNNGAHPTMTSLCSPYNEIQARYIHKNAYISSILARCRSKITGTLHAPTILVHRIV